MDIRPLSPSKRHLTIIRHFKNLKSGNTLEFIADHDPKPLYYQLNAMFGNVVQWSSSEQEEGEWKVSITKTTVSNSCGKNLPDPPQPVYAENRSIRVIKEFDVRNRPCSERHTLVFGTFEELKQNEAFVFTNDHDPKPLYFKLRAEYNDPISWEYITKDPNEWTIRVSKS